MQSLTIPDLYGRRSIRRFQPDPLSQEEIDTLLQAAMAAPSAGDRKPWHFVVVTDPDLRTGVCVDHPHAKMVPQAPVCIVPCGDLTLGYPGGHEFWVQDLSAATENLLLAATALGLGAVWCGVHPVAERVEQVRRTLGLPDDVVPLCLVAVGRPAETKAPRTQYDSDRVHTNGW